MDKCITFSELAANNEYFEDLANVTPTRLVTGNNIRPNRNCVGSYLNIIYEPATFRDNNFVRPCIKRELPCCGYDLEYNCSIADDNMSLLEPNRVWTHLYNDYYSVYSTDLVDVFMIKCANDPGDSYLELRSYGPSTGTTIRYYNTVTYDPDEGFIINQITTAQLRSTTVVLPPLSYSKNGITWENFEIISSGTTTYYGSSSDSKRIVKFNKIYFKDCVDNTIYLSRFIYDESKRMGFSTGLYRANVFGLVVDQNSGASVKNFEVMGNLMTLLGNKCLCHYPWNVQDYSYYQALFSNIFTNGIPSEQQNSTLKFKDSLVVPLSIDYCCSKMFDDSHITEVVPFHHDDSTLVGTAAFWNMYGSCRNLMGHQKSPFPRNLYRYNQHDTPYYLNTSACTMMFQFCDGITDFDYWYVDIDHANTAISQCLNQTFWACTNLKKMPRMYFFEKWSALPILSKTDNFRYMLAHCENLKEMWLLSQPPIATDSAYTSTYLNWYSGSTSNSYPTSCTLDDPDFESKNFRLFVRGQFIYNSADIVTCTNLWYYFRSSNPDNCGPGKPCTYPENTYIFDTAWGYLIQDVNVQYGVYGTYEKTAWKTWELHEGKVCRKFLLLDASDYDDYIKLTLNVSRGDVMPYKFTTDSPYKDPAYNYWPAAMWALRYHNQSAYVDGQGKITDGNHPFPDGTTLLNHVTNYNSRIFISSAVTPSSYTTSMTYTITGNPGYFVASHIVSTQNVTVPFRLGWGHESRGNYGYHLEQTAFLNNDNDIILFERNNDIAGIQGFTGYTSLKCVHTDGKAYIKLPYNPLQATSGVGFEFSFSLTENFLNIGNVWPFGVYNSTGNTQWMLRKDAKKPDAYKTSNTVSFYYNSTRFDANYDWDYTDRFPFDLNEVAPQTIKLYNGMFYPANNGTPVSAPLNVNNGDYYGHGIAVGTILSGSTGNGVSQNPGDTFSIYHIKFYNGTTVTYDLYPVKRKSDNVVGFFDIKNGRFYPSVGSSQFSGVTWT